MNMPLYIRAKFENRRGTLFVESGKVEFSGLIFKDACEAIKLLRHVSEDTIKSTMGVTGFKGFVLEDDTVVGITRGGEIKYFSCTWSAKMAVKILKKKGKL